MARPPHDRACLLPTLDPEPDELAAQRTRPRALEITLAIMLSAAMPIALLAATTTGVS